MALFFNIWHLFWLFVLTPQIHPQHFIGIEGKVLFKNHRSCPVLSPIASKTGTQKWEWKVKGVNLEKNGASNQD